MSHSTIGLEAVPVPGLRVIIRDTWGMSTSSHMEESSIFPALLEGCLPGGWKMFDDMQVHAKALRAGKSSRSKRRVHTIIFFINASSVAVDDSEEMKSLKQKFAQVSSGSSHFCCFLYAW